MHSHVSGSSIPALGLGIGWRPELALAIERYPGLGFVEAIAENLAEDGPIPAAIEVLRDRGLHVVPHGISLSLGGAEPLDLKRVNRLAEAARRCNSPLVSEHIAFVRAGGKEAGHLLPLPRTKTAVDVVVDNVKRAQDILPVPLALENISALFEWPDAQMSEAEFIGQIIDRTGALLLLDLANVWANARNLGGDAVSFLNQLPLHRLAYVHVAGGEEREGIYYDTHSASVPLEVLDLVTELGARCNLPGIMLERDECYPPEAQLHRELDAIAKTVERGRDSRRGREEINALR